MISHLVLFRDLLNTNSSHPVKEQHYLTREHAIHDTAGKPITNKRNRLKKEKWFLLLSEKTETFHVFEEKPKIWSAVSWPYQIVSKMDDSNIIYCYLKISLRESRLLWGVTLQYRIQLNLVAFTWREHINGGGRRGEAAIYKGG